MDGSPEYWLLKTSIALAAIILAFSILSSGGNFVWRSEALFAISVEGIMGNIHVKGSLTVWTLYAYFSDSQNAAFELLVWCM